MLEEIMNYHREFRVALFISGFTIGSFLFSMKTFILKTMRDDFYDNEDYQDKVRQRRELGQNVGFYNPLKNLSKLLLLSITFSFFSALLQISIGYIENYKAVIFCLLVAIISWGLVGVAIYYVSANWSKALDLAEKRAIEKERALQKDK